MQRNGIPIERLVTVNWINEVDINNFGAAAAKGLKRSAVVSGGAEHPLVQAAMHNVDVAALNVKVVEGEKDDISAPGQCLAALRLCTGLPESKKASHLEPEAGHYGIFAGKSWRNNIRPLVLSFIDRNAGHHPTRRATIRAVR